jgi:hypothetical protein
MLECAGRESTSGVLRIRAGEAESSGHGDLTVQGQDLENLSGQELEK